MFFFFIFQTFVFMWLKIHATNIIKDHKLILIIFNWRSFFFFFGDNHFFFFFLSKSKSFKMRSFKRAKWSRDIYVFLKKSVTNFLFISFFPFRSLTKIPNQKQKKKKIFFFVNRKFKQCALFVHWIYSKNESKIDTIIFLEWNEFIFSNWFWFVFCIRKNYYYFFLVSFENDFFCLYFGEKWWF